MLQFLEKTMREFGRGPAPSGEGVPVSPAYYSQFPQGCTPEANEKRPPASGS